MEIDNAVGIKDNCPSCGVSFLGQDIFEYFKSQYKNDEDRALEAATMYGWSIDRQVCFRREIGIETYGYDGVSFYKCPDCGVVWKRFKWSNIEELTNGC